MDLILWRHAEAVDEAPHGDDMQRELTSRGEKQAARVAAWLDRHLTENAKIFCSPAIRCEQTVLTLGRKYKLRSELAPGAPPRTMLEIAQWPAAAHPVLLVGHQPTLGETAGVLLGMKSGVSIRKGAAWWFRSRDDGAVLIAAISPDMV